MDCTEAKSHLSAFASGLTNDLDRSEIEAHLASCESCSLEVELLRGRASGKAPAPANSDWTIEKIFGDGEAGAREGGAAADDSAAADGATAAGERVASAPFENDSPTDLGDRDAATPPAIATPASTPAPAASASHPSLILPPPPPDPDPTPEPQKGRTSKRKSGSWDFEPADASREAAPPEESVVFAEKALNRKREGASNAKAAATRALAWGLGGIAGIALLGVSAWLAMAIHQGPPRAISTGTARSQPESSPEPSPPAEPAPTDTPAPSPPPSPVPSSASTPADSSALGVADARPLQARSFGDPAPVAADLIRKPVPSPPVTSAPGATKPRASSKGAASSAAAALPPKATASTPHSSSAPPTAHAAAPTTTKAAAPTTTPSKPATHDDDDMWPTDDPARGAGSGGSAASKPSASTSPGRSTTPERSPERSAERPRATAPEAPADSQPKGSVPAGASDVRLIDRLHLATEKATAAQDIAALRQLKTTWKSFLKTVVGPDRARAKREFADCLWAIQAISARDADQQETLNAYRDYLLSAPAGGADTRSAERLRELEDALRERR